MNAEILELNHVSLHVSDLERSISFYRDQIGLSELIRPDFDFPGAWFRIGKQQELHLIADPDVVVISGSRKMHFALQVKSVDKIRKILDQKQIPYKGPKKRPDGASQIFILDPDGYFVECCQFIKD